MAVLPVVLGNGLLLAPDGSEQNSTFAIGSTVTLSVQNRGSFDHVRWFLRNEPAGSAAVLSSATADAPTLGPLDAFSRWSVRCIGYDAGGVVIGAHVVFLYAVGANYNLRQLAEDENFRLDSAQFREMLNEHTTAIHDLIAGTAAGAGKSIWGIPIDPPPVPMVDGLTLVFNLSRGVIEWKVGAAVPPITGTLTASLSSLSAAAIGVETFSGALAASLSSLSAAATGGETFIGAGTASLSPLSVVAVGAETFAGTLAAALSPLTVAASGTNISPLWSVDFTSFALSTGSNGTTTTAGLTAKQLSFSRASDGSVQTSATTMVGSVGGSNIAAIGDRGQGRGLRLDQGLVQVWNGYEDMSSWTVGTGAVITQNVGGVTAPNGTTGTVDKVDFTGAANGVGVYKAGGGATPGATRTTSVWLRAVSGTSSFLMQDPQGNPLRERLVVLDTNWQCVQVVAVCNTTTIGIQFTKYDSQATPFYVWGANLADQPVATDTRTIGFLATQAAERLWHTAPAAIIDSGRLTLAFDLLPSGREVDYLAAVRLWTIDASNYCEMSAGVVTVVIGGVSYSTPNAAFFATGYTGDVLRILVAAGGGTLNTVVKVQTRDGVRTLGTSASPQGVISTPSTIDLLCNGAASEFIGLVQKIEAWPAGYAPSWAGSGVTPYSFAFRDWNHVMGAGQSLALGNNGGVALSTSQPYANLMFGAGGLQPEATASNFTATAALIEGVVTETGVSQETNHSGMANLTASRARNVIFSGLSAPQNDHVVFASSHAKGGAAYAAIARGATGYYRYGLAQVRAAKALATAASKTFAVRAVLFTHGESDDLGSSATYQADVTRLQRDLEDDYRAITGQTEPVFMIASQDAAWTKFASHATPITATALLAAARASQAQRIIVACPKYFMSTADGTHIFNNMETWLGEFYAKTYCQVVLQAGTWKNFAPRSITQSGGVITCIFDVPVGPLQFDTTTVTDPGNKGFEIDSGTITSVTITASDTVQIAYTGGPATRLRYAYTGTVGANAGPTTGARGCLKDSDATASLTGRSLANWCLTFNDPIT
jgi:hypothetical protein